MSVLTVGADRSARSSTAVAAGEPSQQTVAPVSAGRDRRPFPAPSALILSVVTSLTLLAVWFMAHALLLSSLQEHGSQSRLYADFRAQLAEATAPLGGRINPGSPVAILSIGAAGITKQVVVEGTTSGDLTHGPGHLSNSVLPGQAGVSVLFGRSVTYGAPFRHIPSLKRGDLIKVVTGQGAFTYRVDRIRRAGSPMPPAPSSGEGRLVLATSEAAGWRRGWAPTRVVYVDATLQGDHQNAPAGKPAAITGPSRPMHGDTGALVPLVLWMEAVLLVAAGMSWSWFRWGRRQTWLIGLPLIVATLWGATGAAELLLPNLF